MGLAEKILLPPDDQPGPLLAQELEWVRRDWLPRVAALLDEARTTRGSEGSPEELKLLRRLYQVLLRPPSGVDLGRWMSLGTRAGQRLFRETFRREAKEADVERRLALHFLQLSVEALFSIVPIDFEVVAQSTASLQAFIAQAPAALPLSEVPATRMMMSIMVAIQLDDGPLDDLTYWAQRAYDLSRRFVRHAGSRADVGAAGSISPTWALAVEGKLEALHKLEVGWDGGRSPPLTDEALGKARELLAALAMVAPAPRIVPVPGGGLQFEWTIDGRELEIEVLPNGGVSYIRSPDGGETGEEVDTSRIRQLGEWVASGAQV